MGILSSAHPSMERISPRSGAVMGPAPRTGAPDRARRNGPRLAWLLLGVLATSPAAAQRAEEAEAPSDDARNTDEPTPRRGPRAAPDGGEGVLVRRARYPSRNEPGPDPEAVARYMREGAEAVPLYQVFEEMIEEVVAELQDEPREDLSPLAVRRVRGSPQLSAWFLDQVEAQLVGMISEHTPHTVRRCVTCDSIRSRVDEDDWVVSVGLATQEQLRREATRIGVRNFLDVRVAYYPEANIAALHAEVFSAEDGTVVWSGAYRSDATTAAILRSGERIQSREERVADLERRIQMRPHLGHQVSAGAAFIPYEGEGGTIFGGTVGYRLIEHFGPDLRWSFGLGATGFLNLSDNPLMGGFLDVTLQYDVLPENLNLFVLKTGPSIGAFFAGEQGNSFVVEWTIDAVFQFLLGIGISAFYFVPVEFANADLGGFGGKARFTVNFR